MLREHPDISQPAKFAPSLDGSNSAAKHAESALVTTVKAFDGDRRTAHEKLLGAKEVAHWLGVSRAWVFPFASLVRLVQFPSASGANQLLVARLAANPKLSILARSLIS